MEMTTSLKQEEIMVAIKKIVKFIYELYKGKKAASAASTFSKCSSNLFLKISSAEDYILPQKFIQDLQQPECGKIS